MDHRRKPVGQGPTVISQQQEVVAVPHVCPDAKVTRDEMVESGEIPVGEPLAGQIADRQTVPPPVWLEQVIAGEVVDDRLLLVAVVNDQVH